jgi:ubiquitin-conjugating enzyme E2 J2
MTKKTTTHIPQQCIIRLQKEYIQIQREEIPNIVCAPREDNILEWHFVIHDLTEEQSPSFCGGIYHGKLVFSPQYPYKPPSIYMCTPNGRFQINQRICTSMSDFHPELWRPLWSVRSILIGLLSFFLDEKEPQTFGSVQTSIEEKRRFAITSMQYNMKNPIFNQLFPQFVEKYKQKLNADTGSHTTSNHLQQQGDKNSASTTGSSALNSASYSKTESYTYSTLVNIGVLLVVVAFILYIAI